MKIDHVSVGGRDLKVLEDAFLQSGMKTEYGGPHSSGLTKMSLLGFKDGSYIELIAPAGPGASPSLWRKQIEEDGGPCAWAIEVRDIAAEVSRAKSLGIPADGPHDYSRKRPDGVSVDWKLGFLGEDEAGALLPFLITDITPRDYRVKPSPSVSGPGSPLTGIAKVVIGVQEISEPARLFMRLYGWKEPEERADLWDGATLASFAGSPVVLAAPTGPGWLRERVQRFGKSPCAFLISAASLEKASNLYPLGDAREWFADEKTKWVGPLEKKGIMIGIIGE